MTLRNNFECDGCGRHVAIEASHGWQQLWPTINEDQRERRHYCPACTELRLGEFRPALGHAAGTMRRFVYYLDKVMASCVLDDHGKIGRVRAAVHDLRAGDDFSGRTGHGPDHV